MTMSVEQAVLAVNRAFYAAFRQRDARAMRALWARRSPVACIHPGWPPLTDRTQVLKSWTDILANPSSPQVVCHGEQVLMLGATAAMVLLVEVIEDHALSATNILVLEDGEWRLVHHQASPLAGTLQDEGDEGPDPDDEAPPGGLLH